MQGRKRWDGTPPSPSSCQPDTHLEGPRQLAAGHGHGGRRGCASDTCCFAGKLRSPASPTRDHCGQGLDSSASSCPGPHARHWCTPRYLDAGSPLVRPPSGGVERPGRAVRFARLMHQRVRVLGGPATRAASGGNLTLARWPLKVLLGLDLDDMRRILWIWRYEDLLIRVIVVKGLTKACNRYGAVRLGGPAASKRSHP